MRGEIAVKNSRAGGSVVASLSNSTIGQGWEGAAGENLDDSVLQQASMKMLEAFDPNYGGFSGAPKFPSRWRFIF